MIYCGYYRVMLDITGTAAVALSVSAWILYTGVHWGYATGTHPASYPQAA